MKYSKGIPMTDSDLLAALDQHHFLHGLEGEHIDAIAACATLMTLKEGEMLLREGHVARSFYLLRAGRVTLELDVPPRGVLRIQTMGPGEVLGWSWFVSPYRWHFSARALSDISVIALDGMSLRQKCSANHDLGYAVLERLASIMQRRLEATRLQLLDLYATTPASSL